MSIDEEEFQAAEAEFGRVIDSPEKLGEDYTDITEQVDRVPDQLIWKYIYTNVSGSLRKTLTEDPPDSFPHWLRELFAEEYIDNQDDKLPPDEFINKALEHLARRRISA